MTKQQLASKIWNVANEMRSKTKIGADDYKTYLLAFIFYKFLSEREEKWLKENGASEEEIKSVEESSEEAKQIKTNVGYFIAYENLFSTWTKPETTYSIGNINEALLAFERNINSEDKKQNAVFKDIFKEVLSLGLDKFGDNISSQTSSVRKIINLIDEIPMDGNQGYDVLGFVYEYLIGNFAANAGKKGGEFYTPHEVSVLMSEIVADHLKDYKKIKIFDSTSGSGSLLINIGKSIQKQLNDENSVSYYAQEKIEETYNLTRMNLLMRGISPANINVRCANTLEDDWPKDDKTLRPLTSINAVVGNPPYSQKWDSKKHEENQDPRYKDYGYAPNGKADYAFLLHDLYHLDPDGIMTIVLPHGTLFRGGTEKGIREKLIETNNIDAIIGLPANIFYGTPIPTIIMVLKKNRINDDVLIIDASRGFEKRGKQNALRARDIKKIVDTYINRDEVENYSRCVSRNEIRNNEYNLNIHRYVDSSEKAEKFDLYAIMNGGIPKSELDSIQKELETFKSLEPELLTPIDDLYVSLKPSTDNLHSTIESNKEVQQFIENYKNAFSEFQNFLYDELITKIDTIPIAAEENVITNELFKYFKNIKLIDKYEVYQLFDDEWSSISVDIEKIQTEGKESVSWVDPKMVTIKKDNNDEENQKEVQKGWTGHIVPFELVQEDIYREELDTIQSKTNRLEEIQEEYGELISELDEDNQGEILNDDNTKFVTKEVKSLAKQLLREKTKYEEGSYEDIIIRANKLMDEESSLRKDIKALKIKIEDGAKTTIKGLTFETSKEYLAQKWISPILEKIYSMPEKVIDKIEHQLIYLNNKYGTTLPEIETELKKTEDELISMLDDLVGNEKDMKAIKDLKKILGN